MIFKFTLVNKSTLVFELLVLLSCGWLLTTPYRYVGAAILALYTVSFIFFNSIFSHNYEFSILKVLNLLKAPVKSKIFFANSLLYFPAAVLLALYTIRDTLTLLMFGSICIYQLVDGILLAKKQKLYAFIAAFLIFTALEAVIFVLSFGAGGL